MGSVCGTENPAVRAHYRAARPGSLNPAYPRSFGGLGGKLPPFVWRLEPPPATAFEEARVAVLFLTRQNLH